MIDMDVANKLAQDWIDAWNRHDIDAIMAHYTEDVEFWSPMIVKLLGNASGKIVGKPELRAYFTRGLELSTGLHFTLIELLVGIDSVTIYFRRHDNTVAAEVMALNAESLVTMVRAHYTPTNSVWQR
jgi:ketosteroid isomerase-like protein